MELRFLRSYHRKNSVRDKVLGKSGCIQIQREANAKGWVWAITEGESDSCEMWRDYFLFSSVLFSCSVVSDSLWPHGLQYTRLPLPSPIPGACSNSCPSSRWCHPTISSSVVPFSCLQSFPALGSFPVSWFFTLGGQNFGASVSESVPPVNIQD